MSSAYSTITSNVNLLLVNSLTITNFNPYIAYVSSVSIPGRIATVRDAVGLVSSPGRLIILSTLKDVLFSDGTSSITISQPFGYVSLSSRDRYTWDVINTFAFPMPSPVSYVSSIYATDSINANSYLARSYISTPNLTTDSISSYRIQASTVSTANIFTQNISTQTLRSFNNILTNVSSQTTSTNNLFSRNVLVSSLTLSNITGSASLTLSNDNQALLVNGIPTGTFKAVSTATTTLNMNNNSISNINDIGEVNNLYVNTIQKKITNTELYIDSITNFLGNDVNGINNINNTNSISTINLKSENLLTNSLFTSSLSTFNLQTQNLSTFNLRVQNLSTFNLQTQNISTCSTIMESIRINSLFSNTNPQINVNASLNFRSNSISNLTTVRTDTLKVDSIQSNVDTFINFYNNINMQNYDIDVVNNIITNEINSLGLDVYYNNSNWSAFTPVQNLDIANFQINNVAQTNVNNDVATNDITAQYLITNLGTTSFDSSYVQIQPTISPTVATFRNTGGFSYFKVTFTLVGDNVPSPIDFYFQLYNDSTTTTHNGSLINISFPYQEEQHSISSKKHSITYTDIYNLSSWTNGNTYYPLLNIRSSGSSVSFNSGSILVVLEPTS